MAPNITEVLFALGLGDRLAGVTRFCDCPAEAASKPKIGGLVDPNIEVIQSLKPDLIIAFRGNPKRVVERLRLLGYPLFVLDAGADFESLFLMINKIGLVTARSSEASRLVGGLRSRVRRVTDLAKGGVSRPGVVFLLSGRGLWTAGRGSFLTGLIEVAGGTNVAAALRAKWAVYKKEQLAADDPDAIFILAPSAEAFAAGREQLERMFPSKGLRAVREGRVFHLDENTASRLGPRLVDTLERTAALIHPELFGSGQ
jgi:iron complex transport system substrate-binding protein